MIKNRQLKRAKTRPTSSFVVATTFAALALAVLASLGDSCYWSLRLSQTAVERASSRTTLDGSEISSFSNANAPQTNYELLEALMARAECCDVSDEGVAECRRETWGGAEQTKNLAVRMALDAKSSCDAVDALEEMSLENEGADSGLSDAIAFLRELDDAPSSDATLWCFDVERGDPLSSVGLVAQKDFECANSLVIQRASSASTRAFFLTAAFGALFAPLKKLFYRIVCATARLSFIANLRRLATFPSYCVISTSPLLLLSKIRLLN